MVHVVHDRRLPFVDAAKDAPADTFYGDVPEETLDQIDPGGGGGREEQMEVLFRFQWKLA